MLNAEIAEIAEEKTASAILRSLRYIVSAFCALSFGTADAIHIVTL